MDIITNESVHAGDLLEEDLNANSSETTRDGFQEFAEYFQFIVEGIAILIVGVIGVGINLVALGILFRKRVRCFFRFWIIFQNILKIIFESLLQPLLKGNLFSILYLASIVMIKGKNGDDNGKRNKPTKMRKEDIINKMRVCTQLLSYYSHLEIK
jgi:hypothetical protein